MASNSTDSSNSRKLLGEQMIVTGLPRLARKIYQVKREIQTERVLSIQERIEANKKKVESNVANHMSLATSRSTTADPSKPNMLLLRMQNPLRLQTALVHGSFDKDNDNIPETPVNITARLPIVEKIPPYTTWAYVTRNHKMADDQSVVGKRQIFYDQIGGEASEINDSEEEIEAPEEEKQHVFSESEKRIIRMVSQDFKPSEEVIQFLTSHIGGTTSEIKEAFSIVKKQDEEVVNKNVSLEPENDMNMLKEKSLDLAMDTFDSLFCRLCLIFDCRLHGCSQKVIIPAERQEYPQDESEEDKEPCSKQCYLISNVDPRTANDLMCEDSAINVDSDTIMNDNSKVKIVWKPLEKDLYLKGLEIYGRNSCLITRNILCPFKTCIEVYMYMHDGGSGTSSMICSTSNDNKITGGDHKEQQILQSLRRKAKGKKQKHSWRSVGHKPSWRGIANGNLLNKQYTPCECKPMCGKECPCQKNSLCCEKFCGCSKSCRNRYRGCYCAKGQCRSQQCPCFAADRECDPDVCRNCWVSCGGGSLGEPSRKGEGQCGNMRLFLRQQQKILFGKSDIVGWGAFLKNTVEKDEYIGEYTGELISQVEADLRGKLYDRANSSFLFNLNDQYVLDALRYGDKLKFANHSATPNCYAKIIKVGGEHRVGIFAKERIEAGQELFYDYYYGPEHTPIWARKPDNPKEGSSAPTSQAQGKKPQAYR